MNSGMTIPTQEQTEAEALHAWLFLLRIPIYFLVTWTLWKSPFPVGDPPHSILTVFSKMLFAIWIGNAASVQITEQFYAWLRRFDWFEPTNKSRRFQALTKMSKGAAVLILMVALFFLNISIVRSILPLVLFWAILILGVSVFDRWQSRKRPPVT
jgi:uncharacterized membrane protein YbaN (DUF454 family)